MVVTAYIKTTGSDEGYRYFVTAPDANTIDEWWRQASTNDTNSLTRINPDYYTQHAAKYPFAYTIEKGLKEKLITGYLHDFGGRVLSWINPPRTDHVSGASFFVRSVSSPDLFWWANDDGGPIWVTRQGRTRFRVSIDGTATKGVTVMIDSDPVVIHAAKNSDLKVSVNNGTLTLGGHSSRLQFGDLKNRFLVSGMYDKANVTEVEDGDGEEWELVS